MNPQRIFLPLDELSALLGRDDRAFWKKHPEMIYWDRQAQNIVVPGIGKPANTVLNASWRAAIGELNGNWTACRFVLNTTLDWSTHARTATNPCHGIRRYSPNANAASI